MNDLTKLSRHERTTAKVLPAIENKLRAAHKLIAEARACAADLVNIEPLRATIRKSAGETLDACNHAADVRNHLIRKANS